MLKRYIGDKAFYKRVIAIVLPMIIQNGITNFVSMLDNIMVGQIGTAAMSGVSIANQLFFVFNICIFGAGAGSGIFTAQFHGSKDHEGVRYTFRFKLICCTVTALLGIAVFSFWGGPLMNTFLQGEGDPAVARETLESGMQYLSIMLLGLIPFALKDAYASTLRETGQTLVPMAAGMAAMFSNLILNWILIFGMFGLPALGIRGAAIATVVSRYIELGVVALWTHRHPEKNLFIPGALRSVHIPGELLKKIAVKSLPLMLNECLWSLSMTIINQSYSTCGLDVVPAMNIFTTLKQLTGVAYLAMGNAVGIIMGQTLGADKEPEEVRDVNRKLMTMAAGSGVVFALITVALAWLFPMLYNTTGDIRTLATQLILIFSLFTPLYAYNHSVYFTIRSGGLILTTTLYDSVSIWVFCVPPVFLLSRLTNIGIIPLFFVGHIIDIVKTVLGVYLLRKGDWIRNLVRK